MQWLIDRTLKSESFMFNVATLIASILAAIATFAVELPPEFEAAKWLPYITAGQSLVTMLLRVIPHKPVVTVPSDTNATDTDSPALIAPALDFRPIVSRAVELVALLRIRGQGDAADKVAATIPELLKEPKA